MKNKKRPGGGSAQANGKLSMSVIDADRARLIAIEFCLFHYPTLYTGGVPRPESPQVWRVPIVLQDPDARIAAQVGELRIDARSGKVLAFTPEAEVVSKGSDLYKGKHDNVASAAGP